jgi:phage major head subunit gpT-like protein
MRGAKFNVVNDDFQAGLTIHQNDIDDGKLNRYRPFIDEMAENARYFKIEFLTKTLLNGFTGNLYPGEDIGTGTSFDGAQFFSASHSMFGGANQSNLVGTVALTEANLNAAQLLLRGQRTWDGKRTLHLKGTHLIVGPKLEKTAIELISASFLINTAGTATRDNSFFKGRYTLMVTVEITGAQENWWFLADLSRATKPLIWQNRRGIETSTQVTAASDGKFLRNILNFGVDARAGVALFDPRVIVGANPVAG